jgi:hypothetical protein
MFRRKALMFLVLLLGAAPAFATTWTVCSSGCDFTSIQDAVNSAVSGDTIQLEAGTYFENVCVTGPLFGRGTFVLAIRGAGASTTTVNGSGEDQPVFAANTANDDSECGGRRPVVLSLSDMTIENSADLGIKATGSENLDPLPVNVNIDDCVIRNNRTGVWAGSFGVAHISRTTITGHSDYGISLAGRSWVSDTTISDNGWGIGVFRTRADVLNSTVSGNAAAGFLLIGTNSVFVSQSTIANNLGPGLKLSGYPGDHPRFEATGSIMANNPGGNCWITSQGANLSSDSCSMVHPTDIIAADPLLLPLADNGGPTATHALDPGSPAIDAGGTECEPADQRGVERPQDGDGDGIARCDIGAFELAPIVVEIDIKPGGYPNTINPRSRGVIPVAILGSETFDVADIDVTTLRFGPNESTCKHDLTDNWMYDEHLQDVNLDGFMDLMTHFRTRDTGIECGDEAAALTGGLVSGHRIEGSDFIRTVGCRAWLLGATEERTGPIQNAPLQGPRPAPIGARDE